MRLRILFCVFCVITFDMFSQNEPTCDYWDVTFTSGNATIAIQEENFDNILLGCCINGLDVEIPIMDIQCPMWIGVYQNIQVAQCFGYTEWTGETTSIAAWGDDPTTDEIDGFQDGDYYQLMLCIEGFGVFYSSSLNLDMSNEPPFSDTYSTNGFASVNSVVFYSFDDLDPVNIAQSCWPVDLLDYNAKTTKHLVKEIDLYGRDISSLDSRNSIVIQIYNDNSVTKTYKF